MSIDVSVVVVLLGLVANLITLGRLVFKAGKLVHSVDRNDHHINNMRGAVVLLGNQLAAHGERIASLEAKIVWIKRGGG